jgi:ribonucleoside-diphosphate reductase alpha chain
MLASARLASERGVFPNYRFSTHRKNNIRMRNATVNTIAPTGTISIIAGCSSGIEPIFAVSYVRNVLSGAKLFEVHPLFEEEANKRGLLTKELMSDVAHSGSIQAVRRIPADIKKLFVTALDVPAMQHLSMQAAFQRYTDNSVSKTINLPYEATIEDVRNIYLSAYRLRLKGITIYRYGTKREQVLSFGRRGLEGKDGDELVAAAPDYSGGCVSETCIF